MKTQNFFVKLVKILNKNFFFIILSGLIFGLISYSYSSFFSQKKLTSIVGVQPLNIDQYRFLNSFVLGKEGVKFINMFNHEFGLLFENEYKSYKKYNSYFTSINCELKVGYCYIVTNDKLDKPKHISLVNSYINKVTQKHFDSYYRFIDILIKKYEKINDLKDKKNIIMTQGILYNHLADYLELRKQIKVDQVNFIKLDRISSNKKSNTIFLIFASIIGIIFASLYFFLRDFKMK